MFDIFEAVESPVQYLLPVISIDFLYKIDKASLSSAQVVIQAAWLSEVLS